MPEIPQNEPRTAVPECELSTTPLLLQNIDTDNQDRIKLILDEFIKGFRFVKEYSDSVTFFGSARTKAGDPNYESARSLANRIVKECNYSIVTGGGPGIMEAANRGACEADGNSLGLTIRLPKEQTTNAYVRKSVDFHYFFTRKVLLAFSAEAYIFFPGGFGTMDELFEILTLIQTNKVKRVPIILVDHGYWQAFDSYIKEHLLSIETISQKDVELYTITNDEDEIITIINNASKTNIT